MSKRFQIEDLVVQDASGVVFRALDMETQEFVALRRFFPSGADGGGLNSEQQAAYQQTVSQLAAVTHPALRSIISGDCDPIDGMPYIATEWIEGSRLSNCLLQGPLTPEEVTHLLTQALEVSQILSAVLGEEGIWIETGPEAIVIGAEETGRNVTFWIAPQKWLGKNDSRRGLECIVELTQTLMGWHSKSVSEHAGKGLGRWLKWLRGVKKTASLQEVREMLAASTGVGSPASATRLFREAFQPRRSKKSRLLWALSGGLVLLAVLLGAWASLGKKPPEIDPSPILVSLTDRQQLMRSENKEVVVIGTFESMSRSANGITLYLQFSKNPGVEDTRGALPIHDAPDGLTESQLAALIGKNIRLHGTVVWEETTRRPLIVIRDRKSIQVIE